MRKRRLLFLLIGVMFAVVVFVTGTTIYLLFTAAFEIERTRLVDTVRRNARVIEGIVSIRESESGRLNDPEREELIDHVIELYSKFQFEGFGRTGAFMIGRRIGDQIVTLLRWRIGNEQLPQPVPFNSGLAEPMHQALLGNAGSLVGQDYRGETVLAAYEPVAELGLGVVAKVDVGELRAPFVHAGLIAALAAALTTLLGAALFARVTAPFIRRLTESEARSREVIDTAADAIITVNEHGQVESCNPAAQRLFGYDQEEVRDLSINTLLPNTFVPRGAAAEPGMRTLVEDALRLDPGREIQGVAQDGRRFPVEASFRQTMVQGRQCFTAVCRDITPRKEAEAQILLAKEQAERSNQAKTEFMAMISHELRTPMNGVLGMTSLLLSTPLNEEQQRYADAVRASGGSLLNIINDILDYSKIEAGILELEQADLEPGPLVEGVVDLLQMQAGTKGIELTAFVDPAVPPVLRGDSGRLKQVLFNLVGNAVKFTEVGGVVVEVTLAGRSEQHVDLRCEVTDTGIGIPSGTGARLFERFTQADSSTSRRYGGTGLGLAIAKQITTLMGGQIGYESELAQGSRFWFTVRLALPEEVDPPAAPPDGRLAGRRVLLVEGLDINRGALRKQLAGLGLQVSEAATGAAAIGQFAEAERAGQPFGIVLGNRSLPDMSGDDLLRGLRRMPGGAHCKTVLMATLGERDAAKPGGSDAISWIATKPVHQSSLREGLLRLLESREARPPTLAPPRTEREPSRHPPLRILLAEDNPVNQLLASAYLKKMGHVVDAVSNGRDAVAALQENPYDLILMDVHMPDVDGLEAAAEIRSRVAAERRDVPIIAVTADVMRGDRERFLEAGMNDHIAKPFDYDSLAEIVQRWAGQRINSLDDDAPPPGPQDDA